MRPPTKSRKPWGRWASTSPRWTTSNFVLHLEPDTGYNLPISAPPNDVSTPSLLCLLAEQQAAAALAASCSCTLDRIFRKHSEDERFCEFSAYKTSFPRLLFRTSSSWISRPVWSVTVTGCRRRISGRPVSLLPAVQAAFQPARSRRAVSGSLYHGDFFFS